MQPEALYIGTMMIEMTTVSVGRKVQRGFFPNKDVNGYLYYRTTRVWRGRKFVIWKPWRIDAEPAFTTQYSLDLEAELEKMFTSLIAESV